jgi:predicted site-specific integrase-resolvase
MPNMGTESTGRVYRIRDVADRLGVSYKTVWKWCRVQKTVNCIIWPSGSVRVPEAELQRLLTQETDITQEA